MAEHLGHTEAEQHGNLKVQVRSSQLKSLYQGQTVSLHLALSPNFTDRNHLDSRSLLGSYLTLSPYVIPLSLSYSALLSSIFRVLVHPYSSEQTRRDLILTASRSFSPSPSTMPAVTRARARAQQRRNLPSLPAEILAEIWQYVLNTDGQNSHLIRFTRPGLVCTGYHITELRSRSCDCNELATAKQFLFSRQRCPPVLLVSKQMYNEAISYMCHGQIFLVEELLDLWKFTGIAPKNLISTSTAFEVRYVT